MLSLSLPDLPHYWLCPLAAATDVAAVLTPLERIWCAQLPAALRDRYSASRRLLRHHLAVLLGLRSDLVPLHSPPAAPSGQPGPSSQRAIQPENPNTPEPQNP